MALSTYTGLLAAVADYLNRADLSTQIVDFVTLAEAKFNRNLRVRAMMTRDAPSATSEYLALPSDFLEMYSLKLDVSNLSAAPSLQYVGEQEAAELIAARVTGNMRWYTITDGYCQFIPAPSTATTLRRVYYAKVPALSSNSANWLLTKSPDLYLYSALLEASPFLKDDERLPIWAAAQKQLMDDMTLENERAMRPQNAIAMRRRTFG